MDSSNTNLMPMKYRLCTLQYIIICHKRVHKILLPKFREINLSKYYLVFTKYFSKMFLLLTMWKFRKSTYSHSFWHFWQIFRESYVFLYLRKLLRNWFHEIFSKPEHFSCYFTLCCLESWNFFVKSIYEEKYYDAKIYI